MSPSAWQIKLFFPSSPKTLSSRFDLKLVYRGQVFDNSYYQTNTIGLSFRNGKQKRLSRWSLKVLPCDTKWASIPSVEVMLVLFTSTEPRSQNLMWFQFTFQFTYQGQLWKKTAGGTVVKNLSANCKTCRFNSLQKEMVTHSSILAWKLLWIEKPGRLYSP